MISHLQSVLIKLGNQFKKDIKGFKKRIQLGADQLHSFFLILAASHAVYRLTGYEPFNGLAQQLAQYIEDVSNDISEKQLVPHMYPINGVHLFNEQNFKTNYNWRSFICSSC